MTCHNPTYTAHQELWEIVEPYWTPNSVLGHGPDHAQRAYLIAEKVAEAERADFLVVGAACYLMDAGIGPHVGRDEHIKRSIEIARQTLKSIPRLRAFTDEIVECIAAHEAETRPRPTVRLDALVVRDADTLDRIGFDGVRMTLTYGTWCNRSLLRSDERNGVSFEESTYDYLVYLCSLSRFLSTDTAKQLANERTRNHRAYLTRLEALGSGSPHIGYSEAFGLLNTMEREASAGAES